MAKCQYSAPACCDLPVRENYGVSQMEQPRCFPLRDPFKTESDAPVRPAGESGELGRQRTVAAFAGDSKVRVQFERERRKRLKQRIDPLIGPYLAKK